MDETVAKSATKTPLKFPVADPNGLAFRAMAPDVDETDAPPFTVICRPASMLIDPVPVVETLELSVAPSAVFRVRLPSAVTPARPSTVPTLTFCGLKISIVPNRDSAARLPSTAMLTGPPGSPTPCSALSERLATSSNAPGVSVRIFPPVVRNIEAVLTGEMLSRIRMSPELVLPIWMPCDVVTRSSSASLSESTPGNEPRTI